VVTGYATACGADRAEWEQRWRACAEKITQAHTETQVVGALPDGDARDTRLPQAHQLRPEDPGPAQRRRRARQNAPALAAVALTTAALLVGIGAAADAPIQASPASARTATPGPAIIEPLGRTCDPNGVIARMPAHTRSSPAQTARVRASFEAGFQPSRDGWSSWWDQENVVEELTTSEAFKGKQSLRVQVTSGETAIGTIHLSGLTPGGTVTVHIWYSGQGEGHICPFAQNKKGTIEWIPQEDLHLTPSDVPGWRTYTWTVPDFALKGTGIELNDTGASAFVILLDAVTW
jgi:hypothetical protein